MRRSVILLSFIALLVSFLASCSKDKDSDLLSSDNDYFAYPVRNIMQKFGVDESHNLYYAEYKDSGKVRLLEDKNGETYEEPIMESYLYCIDFNGNLVNTYNLGETITNNLYISNGKAYYTLGITIDTSFPIC